MFELLIFLSEKLANWLGISFLSAILVLCGFGFQWRSNQFNLKNGPKSPEARLWYNPVDVSSFFDYIMKSKLDKKGLRIYALTQITLDFVFPIALGCFFATIITFLYSSGINKTIIIVPLLAIIFDLCENLILAYLALNFTGSKFSLSWLAAVCTSLKWVMIAGSVLFIFGGLIYRYVL